MVGRTTAVFQQKAFVAAVICLAHRRRDADIGGDSGEDNVLDALLVEDEFEVGGAERTLAGLVDDRLAFDRIEFGDDVPAGFATRQDAAAGAGIANA